jgi:3-hydroxyacyl-CoA dehydrogenase
LDKSDQVGKWLTDKIDHGDLGAKTGKGFYEWPEGSAMKTRQQLTQRFVDILKAAKQN